MKKDIILKLTEVAVNEYNKTLSFDVPDHIDITSLDGIFDFLDKEIKVTLKLINNRK